MTRSVAGVNHLKSKTAEFVRQHCRVYSAIITPDLKLAATSNEFTALASIPTSGTAEGEPLTSVFVEFIGLENKLELLAKGEGEAIIINQVYREGANGKPEYYTFRVSPLATKPEGGLAFLIHDVTEQGNLEQALVQRRNETSLLKEQLVDYTVELESRNRDLDAFGYTVAHDLRSPISSFISYMDLLEYIDDIPEEAIEYIQRAKGVAHIMDGTIRGLLELASLRDPKDVIGPIDMTPVLAKVTERFTLRLKHQKIEFVAPSDPPPVKGYDSWVEAILTNLVENAIKFIGSTNPSPHIEIRGTVDGDTVRYEVIDNGLGIPKEKQDQLFEMFSRFHLDEAEGYGLGLSIVTRIIEKMNGSLGVESTEGKGSTFWFALPAAKLKKSD